MKRSVLHFTAASAVLVGCALLVQACGGFAAGKRGNHAVPQPAKTVDLQRYLGKWYEYARYENRFERGCEAVTAEYGLREDGLVSVRNTCGNGGEKGGGARVSEGRAKVVPDSGNAKLKVSFFGPFYVGDYWVLDHADDYSWSIVGEPSGRYLWILTREARPDESVGLMLMERARALGYDTAMLRKTAQ
ncbi:lipocalin family protein [Cupriavidus agavae]|uniref:Outer membrane lipoprotein Blc n=1 Tax=Cupriavidus agavae TaxID=1001822 RepID=A0A4V2FGI3_9BURK|nr:lipocalin family protein [Cupriavidus agavae]RZT36879.1 apolipoprotein D and lipocalin family protein [Cupriavidus agavae]